MDGSDGVSITIAERLGGIDRAAWNKVANLANGPGAFDPFTSWEFLESLEASGCATARTGWDPHHVLAKNAAGEIVGALPLYLKTHSYGEYVFDRGWADAFHRAGGRYYPKLQSAAPFTPATGRRFLTNSADIERALLAGALDVARKTSASSLHITFLTGEEQARLKQHGLLALTGVQFHWHNDGYSTFADFLGALSSQKRKTLRRERERACAGLNIRELTGNDITEADWDFFFDCYQDTGSRKWGSPYLNRDFFSVVGERMKDRIVLFIAEEAGRPIASALNFLGGDTLYGRYWGRVRERDFLHFELCYYRAIDMAIRLGLKRVEAGAQGEHKLARGYAPVPTYSAHWIEHEGFRQAVARFLAQETPAMNEEIELLAEHTPFRKGAEDQNGEQI
jgi:predicted N-acyltransferase